MNFRKPRDSGLVKRVIRFQMINHNPHLTAVEKYNILKNRYITLRAHEEMAERIQRYNLY